MRIRAIHRPLITFRLRTLCTRSALVFAALIAVSSFGQSLCFEAAAQTGGEGKSQASGAGDVPPGQSVAPIGNSGYLVPIPEIRMNRIIGDKSAPSSTPTPPKELPSVTPAPAKELPPVEEEGPPPPAERPATLPDGPDVNSLPFEPLDHRPEVEKPLESRPVQEAPEKEYRPPVLQSPAVPEDIMEAPAPKKERLGKKTAPVMPPLLDLEPVKRTSKNMPLESTKAQDDAGSKEGIPLDPRREPETIPAVEPEAPKEVLAPPEPAQRPLTAPTPEHLPEPALKEPVPSALTPPAVEGPAEPEPALPAVEQPIPPAKEILPSPLAQEALDSPEVREYLRETAPLLEELSLLMTRAPSLNIADYDPSDADAPIVPKEIYLKMDSMKRELQNLDSKTFAIIPPPKYGPFHAVIRESITETYQACDAIISYLNERNDENFQKIMEHLTKARELIRKTRSAQG
jgi:hypothetical protein